MIVGRLKMQQRQEKWGEKKITAVKELLQNNLQQQKESVTTTEYLHRRFRQDQYKTRNNSIPKVLHYNSI